MARTAVEEHLARYRYQHFSVREPGLPLATVAQRGPDAEVGLEASQRAFAGARIGDLKNYNFVRSSYGDPD